MSNLSKVEYRVREITRYVVTRYHEGTHTGGVDTKGEYDNATVAHEVAYALCKAEHQQLGWDIYDDRIQYPRDDAGSVPDTPVTARLPFAPAAVDACFRAIAAAFDPLDDDAEGPEEMEPTREMIEAGVAVLGGYNDDFESAEDATRRIWQAMEEARLPGMHAAGHLGAPS